MGDYSIVFEGRIAPGARPEEVKRKLADLYRVDLAKIEGLFSGRQMLIKKNLDSESARRKKAVFEKTGARCRIVSTRAKPHSDAAAAAPSKRVLPAESAPASLFHPRRKTHRNRRYRIYHSLYMSFYSKDLYRDAACNWKGFAYTYLLFVLTLCTLVSAFEMQHQVSEFVDHSAVALVHQIPNVSIDSGEIFVDGKQPCVIVDPDTGKELAILDTTGQVTSLEDTEALILLTHNQLMYRKSARETRIIDLSGIEELQINHQRIYAWLEFIRQWLTLAVAPFLLIGSFFYRLFQVLFYALVAWIMAKVIHTELAFHGLVSIAVVGITPALILLLGTEMLGIAPPQARFLSFLITTGFLYFGVRANTAVQRVHLQSA